MASGGQMIPVVQGLTKIVEAGLHLAYLFPAPEDLLKPFPLPEGVIPLFSVSYKEIELIGVDKVYQLAKSEVLPLKNFLVGRKEGLDENKAALSFYCAINEKNEVNYCLTVESMFIDKLLDSLESPDLSAEMLITGLGADHVVHLDKPCIFFNLYKNARFNLTSRKIAKQALENLAGSFQQNRKIHFHLTVNIKSLGAAKIINDSPKRHMDLNKLYDLPESSKDVTIVASNNAEIKTHKIILMAQSPVFLSMLSDETGMAEANSGRILMEENSAEGITMFVRYLYGLQIPFETISPDLALELFKLGHMYDICDLEKSLKTFFNHKDVNWFTVGTLLDFYFFVKNIPSFEDLADHVSVELSKIGEGN